MTHVTVRKAADGRAVLSQCRKSQLFYCPFCQPSIFKPRDYASVMTHIESHRLKAVLHREFTIFICHLECRTAKHFHCPYCPKTYVNRRDFTKHIPQCEVLHRPRCSPDVTSAIVRGPDVTSATMRDPDIRATIRSPDATSPPMRGPDSTSVPIRAPDFTSAPMGSPYATSAAMKGPDFTSAPMRGPDITSATMKGPDFTSATERTPGSIVNSSEMASSTAIGPGSSAIAPDITSATETDYENVPGSTLKCSLATVRVPNVCSSGPGSARPAVRSAVREKIKCPSCNLWLNRNNLKKHQLRKHSSSNKDITLLPAGRMAVKRKNKCNSCSQLRNLTCNDQATRESLDNDNELCLEDLCLEEPKRWRENPANTIFDLMAPWLDRLTADQQFEVVRLLMAYILELMDQYPGSGSST